MKQFYYTILTLIRGRGSNVIKVISLTLGLLVSIILFILGFSNTINKYNGSRYPVILLVWCINLSHCNLLVI